MNNLKVIGTQVLNNIKMKIIEGGFGENQKCMLAKTIADVHGIRLDKVNDLIKSNIDEFEVGTDILDMKNSNLVEVSLLEVGFTKQSISNSKNIYLLSEQGYMLLVSFMKTDTAKSIRKVLRRQYFQMREQIKQKIDSYMIDDPIARATKWIEEEQYREVLVKNVQAQKEIIEEYKPKIEYHDKMQQSKGLFTVKQIAEDYGISAIKLNKILHQLKIQYHQSGQWLLYSEYKGKDYVQGEPFIVPHNSGYDEIKLNTKWTMKGRELIYYKLKAIGIHPTTSDLGKQLGMGV